MADMFGLIFTDYDLLYSKYIYEIVKIHFSFMQSKTLVLNHRSWTCLKKKRMF